MISEIEISKKNKKIQRQNVQLLKDLWHSIRTLGRIARQSSSKNGTIHALPLVRFKLQATES
jgi:hypothetical protein